MTEVKPSKQYRMTVVPYRPYRRFLLWATVCVLFAASVYGSFLAGKQYAQGDYSNTVSERDELRLLNENNRQEIERLEQQVANLNLGSQVDRKANEAIRSEMVALKQRIDELEQDNQFYRDLMTPAPGDNGIVIDIPVIKPVSEPGHYKYNLVVKQIAAKHSTVTGYLEFVLSGRQGEEVQRFPLKQLSEKVDTDRLKLKFKYFQRISGQMVLPDGFEPQQISVKIVAQTPRKTTIEKKFGWTSKES